MQLIRKNGSTSNILRAKLRNSSTGQGLTGLTSASSGLVISTISDNEAAATTYTGSTIETVTTLGTFAAPTATKARFREVDATNQPGVYELQFADARFAVSGAKTLRIAISGAASLMEKEVLVQLDSFDLDSATVTLAPAEYQKIVKEVLGIPGTVWHVASGGSGGNDGLTWATAKALPTDVSATAGDAILLGGSDFNLGTGAFVPGAGVTVIGVKGVTKIHGTHDYSSDGKPLVAFGNNNYFRDFYVYCTTGSTTTVCLGNLQNAAASGSVLENITWVGGDDSVILWPGSNSLDVVLRNCRGFTSYDNLFLGTGTIRVDLYDCVLRDDPLATIGTCHGIFVSDANTTVNMYRGHIAVRAATAMAGVDAFLGTVNAFDTSFRTSGAGTKVDLQADAGAVINAVDCKGSNTDGALRTSGAGTVNIFGVDRLAKVKAKTDSLTFTVANQVDATAASISNNAITAASIATDAITNAKIAAGAITSSEAPNLDAAVTSRMATYTQPTGFLAADFTRLDAAVSSRMATYVQPTGFLAGDFTRLDVAISSRMATFTLPTNFPAMDIAATGEVGLDFTNTKLPGSPMTLTNVGLGYVDQANTVLDFGSTAATLVNGIRSDTQAILPKTNLITADAFTAGTRFLTMLETPGAGIYRYTTAALVNGPSGSGLDAAQTAAAVQVGMTDQHYTPARGDKLDHLDADVSTAGGGLDAAGVRAAIGMATNDLDTQLSGIGTQTAKIGTNNADSPDEDTMQATVALNLDAKVSEVGIASGEDINVNLTVTPTQANASNPRYSTRDLAPIAQFSAPTDLKAITDANGDPVDLSGKTVRIVFASVQSVGDEDTPIDDELEGAWQYDNDVSGGLMVGGVDNNVLTITHDWNNNTTTGEFRYFIWNVTDRVMLVKGKVAIEPAVIEVA